MRVVCPLRNGPHAMDMSATRQVWCPCAPGGGPLGPTPRGPFTSSTYIPSTPPNSMINSGGLLSGTDALDRRCCCGLLQAAAGCCGLLLVPLLVLLLLSFVFQDSSGAYVAATGLVGSGSHPSYFSLPLLHYYKLFSSSAASGDQPPQHCKMPSEPFGRTLHVPVGRPY